MSSLIFAADGRSFWVALSESPKMPETWAIHRLDPASGRPLQMPIPTAGEVGVLVATADGKYLVGTIRGPGSDEGNDGVPRTTAIVVWEAASGQVIRKVEGRGELQRRDEPFVGLSPDGKSIIAWMQNTSNSFEGLTFTVDGKESPVSLGPHPLGTWGHRQFLFQNNLRSALVIRDGHVQRWSVGTPGVPGPGEPAPFRVVFEESAPDGRSVVSCDEGRVFDSGAWPPRASGVRFIHPGWLRDDYHRVKYSPDGRFLTTWSESGLTDRRLWRLPHPHGRPLPSHGELARQQERRDYYMFAQFDPQRTGAVLWWRGHLRAHWHEALNVRYVDLATGAVRDATVRHTGGVRDVAFSADGRYFASGSDDGSARVWESATGRPAGPPLRHRNFVATVAFSPDGNTLAAGDYGPSGLIKFWDWRTGKETREPFRHNDIILNVSYSPDGRYVSAVKARDWSQVPELLVWDTESGSPVVRVPHSGDQEYSYSRHGLAARFRPDSRAIAVRDTNGVLRQWEIPSGTLLGERPLDGNGVTRYSPDGRMIAASTNLGVRLLDGQTLTPLIGGYLPHPDPIQDLAFSPDRAYLLTAHTTGSAQLWDVATRKPVGPPTVLIGLIRAVAFTPDSKTCLCVAADGTVRRWPVPGPFNEPDLARLADRVALTTGLRMDENQGVDTLSAKEWGALRVSLAGENSTALVSPRPDAEWHDDIAADAEQDVDSFGAEWHLDRLAALRPNDWLVLARRGRVFAAAGRNDEAAAAYDKAAHMAPSPQVLSDWLRARASDDQAAGRKEAAVWNLDRAIHLTSKDWTLYALRAKVSEPSQAFDDCREAIRLGGDPNLFGRELVGLAEIGDWKRCAGLFNAAARGPGLNTQGRYTQAVANLKAGDSAGYRSACAGIAQRLPPVGPRLKPAEANDAAMAFAVGPAATDDWTIPLAWIDHALARVDADEKDDPDRKEQIQRQRHIYLNTRGVLLYRAGRYEESARVLREGVKLPSDGSEVHDWVFLALVEHRLGRIDAAKAAAAKAREGLVRRKPRTGWDRAESELLTAELDAALPPAGR
jgi:WD40 repeat protein/Flp pilus assembly protein TadD